MQDYFQATLAIFGAIFGAISVIGGGATMIVKLFSPYKKLREDVSNHTVLLEKDNKRINEKEKSDRIICKTLLVLIEHEITGNSIDKLKNTKQELQEYLINK